MSASDSESSSEDDDVSNTDIERTRTRLGLAPLTAEGRAAINWAISRSTPAAERFQRLLAITKRLGADFLRSDDQAAWGRALPEVDALAYCVRLIEVQIIAGNIGSGILLPDARLEAER